jgi:hypothetical protein
MSLPGVIFGRSEALSFSSDTEYLDTSGVGSVRVPHGDFLNLNKTLSAFVN